MKIKSISIYAIKVPLVHPYVLSNAYGTMNDTDQVIVKITTDEGIVGWGEGNPWPAFTGDTERSVVANLQYYLAPALLGKDPTNLNAVHQTMDGLIRGNCMAKAAIDMACYDITGKYYGIPVHTLLGGKLRDTIRCFWSVGGSTPEETAAETLDVKNQGYWGCMIKIGTDYKNDIARTLAVREAVGPDYPLIADANQGWDIDTAVKYGLGVRSADLLFFEQPVKWWDIQGLAEVRRRVTMPVSADEGVSTIQNAKDLVKVGACDYFSIKTSKHGGILPAKKICDFAEEHGVKMFFNSMLEGGITQSASLNIASTTTGLLSTTGHSFFSTLRLKKDITNFASFVKEGITHVPTAPGLGIEVNSEMLDELTAIRADVMEG